MTIDQFAVIVLGLAFVLGVRSTIRLGLKYRIITKLLFPDRNLIGLVFFHVALIVTIVVGFFGFLAARRLLGYTPFAWSAATETVLAIPVLFIPVILDGTFDYIADPDPL